MISEEQIELFLQRHKNFTTVNIQEVWERKLEKICPFTEQEYAHFSPLTTETDGFFVCILEQK